MQQCCGAGVFAQEGEVLSKSIESTKISLYEQVSQGNNEDEY